MIVKDNPCHALGNNHVTMTIGAAVMMVRILPAHGELGTCSPRLVLPNIMTYCSMVDHPQVLIAKVGASVNLACDVAGLHVLGPLHRMLGRGQLGHDRCVNAVQMLG